MALQPKKATLEQVQSGLDGDFYVAPKVAKEVLLGAKVDKVAGRQLSDLSFTKVMESNLNTWGRSVYILPGTGIEIKRAAGNVNTVSVKYPVDVIQYRSTPPVPKDLEMMVDSAFPMSNPRKWFSMGPKYIVPAYDSIQVLDYKTFTDNWPEMQWNCSKVMHVNGSHTYRALKWAGVGGDNTAFMYARGALRDETSVKLRMESTSEYNILQIGNESGSDIEAKIQYKMNEIIVTMKGKEPVTTRVQSGSIMYITRNPGEPIRITTSFTISHTDYTPLLEIPRDKEEMYLHVGKDLYHFQSSQGVIAIELNLRSLVPQELELQHDMFIVKNDNTYALMPGATAGHLNMDFSSKDEYYYRYEFEVSKADSNTGFDFTISNPILPYSEYRSRPSTERKINELFLTLTGDVLEIGSSLKNAESGAPESVIHVTETVAVGSKFYIQVHTDVKSNKIRFKFVEQGTDRIIYEVKRPLNYITHYGFNSKVIAKDGGLIPVIIKAYTDKVEYDYKYPIRG